MVTLACPMCQAMRTLKIYHAILPMPDSWPMWQSPLPQQYAQEETQQQTAQEQAADKPEEPADKQKEAADKPDEAAAQQPKPNN